MAWYKDGQGGTALCPLGSTGEYGMKNNHLSFSIIYL